jgi:hypothetical protein
MGVDREVIGSRIKNVAIAGGKLPPESGSNSNKTQSQIYNP